MVSFAIMLTNLFPNILVCDGSHCITVLIHVEYNSTSTLFIFEVNYQLDFPY